MSKGKRFPGPENDNPELTAMALSLSLLEQERPMKNRQTNINYKDFSCIFPLVTNILMLFEKVLFSCNT